MECPWLVVLSWGDAVTPSRSCLVGAASDTQDIRLTTILELENLHTCYIRRGKPVYGNKSEGAAISG